MHSTKVCVQSIQFSSSHSFLGTEPVGMELPEVKLVEAEPLFLPTVHESGGR